MNIKDISTQELINDRAECRLDIKLCQVALALDIENYSNGNVIDRICGNQAIIAKIEAELTRRATTEQQAESEYPKSRLP